MKLEQAIDVDVDAAEVEVDVVEMYKDRITYIAHQRVLQLQREHNLSVAFVQSYILPTILCGLEEMYDLFNEVEDWDDLTDILASWQEIVYSPSWVGGEEN